MVKRFKDHKYDQFHAEDGKLYIGGSEIIKGWKSHTNSWVWYATNLESKKPMIYFGFVQGMASEWGTWYKTDMDSVDIVEIPTEELHLQTKIVTEQ